MKLTMVSQIIKKIALVEIARFLLMTQFHFEMTQILF